MNFNKIANQVSKLFKDEGTKRSIPEFISIYYSYKFDTFKEEDFYMSHVEIGPEDNISFLMARKENTIDKSSMLIDEILFSNKIYTTILVPKEVLTETNVKVFIDKYLKPLCKFIASKYIHKYLNYHGIDVSLEDRNGKLLEIKIALLLFGYSELKDIYKPDILKLIRDNNFQDPIAEMLLLLEIL